MKKKREASEAANAQPESGVQLRSDLPLEILDDLAEVAGVAVSRCLIGRATHEMRIETARSLRQLAARVRNADEVFFATLIGAAEEIEALIGAEERAS